MEISQPELSSLRSNQRELWLDDCDIAAASYNQSEPGHVHQTLVPLNMNTRSIIRL